MLGADTTDAKTQSWPGTGRIHIVRTESTVDRGKMMIRVAKTAIYTLTVASIATATSCGEPECPPYFREQGLECVVPPAHEDCLADAGTRDDSSLDSDRGSDDAGVTQSDGQD